MGLFSSNKQEEGTPSCPIADVLGEPIFFLDGRGSNLYVYDKCVVIDRTQGGLFNAWNRTYKIIPLKYIIAVQVKSTGVTTGFLEFSTYGHENTNMKGLDRVNDEDNINFSSEESAAVAREIVKFVVPRIL